jgi:hypothetical protein
MRGSVKEPRRAHVAPFSQHDAEWKMLVNFADPHVIFVVLADPRGTSCGKVVAQRQTRRRKNLRP